MLIKKESPSNILISVDFMSYKLIFSRKECHAKIYKKSKLHELQGTLIGRDRTYKIPPEGDSCFNTFIQSLEHMVFYS